MTRSVINLQKKNRWISRLDLMFCSPNTIKSINKFEIIQGNCNLPSDHAIITCSLTASSSVNLKEILQRTVWLNEYAIPTSPCKRGIKYDSIDEYLFKENLEKLVLESILTLDMCVDFLTQNMYICAEQSQVPPKNGI